MNTHVPTAMLRRDPISIIRLTETADAEGNVVANPVTSEERGFWRELSTQEQTLGTRRGTMATSQVLTTVDKDIRAGDRLVVHGDNWEVVQADTLRGYKRFMLRKVAN